MSQRELIESYMLTEYDFVKEMTAEALAAEFGYLFGGEG